MKSVSVYDFHDYRAYLRAHILNCAQGKHGEKSRIATAIRCHNAYFSQILSGKADLSLEQTQELSEYLSLNEPETDYLLLLVNHGRAGTQKLRTYYLQKIRSIDEKRMRLENRIPETKQITKEHQSIYFSAWYYSEIHLMVTTLSGYASVPALQKALKLPALAVKEALQFLEESGIVKRDGLKYVPGPVNLFLGADHSMIRAHHTHWRMQAIRSLENRDPEDTHYSAVVTVKRADFNLIRKHILTFLEQHRSLVAESSEEDTVAALTLDWFLV